MHRVAQARCHLPYVCLALESNPICLIRSFQRLLQTTKIGRTLTALSKKSSCVRVTDSALKLVAEWRKAAAAESRAVKNIAIMTPRVQIQQRTHSNDSEWVICVFFCDDDHLNRLQSTTPARVVHIVSHETIRDGMTS